jgi:uncharacterized protein YihD (DUF1040 family)
MRDPNRIEGIIQRLREVWFREPDLRLGQLILNGPKFGSHPNLDNLQTVTKVFNIEDEELIALIEMMYPIPRRMNLEQSL